MVQRLVELNEMVEAAEISLTPILLTNQTALLRGHHPHHHIKGTQLTAILLFHHDPTLFLSLLDTNTFWNPSHLILFCLNPHLNTTSLLTMPVVQRSQFVLYMNLNFHLNRLSLFAYTSFPLQLDNAGLPLLKVPLGPWSLSRFPSLQSLFPSRFNDFGGLELQLSSWCADEPFLYFDKQGRCIGQNLDALEIIGDKHNFTFVPQDIPSDYQWGDLVNGNWTGMFGDILYRGKHMVVSSMPLNYERARDFDFVYPYYANGFGFLLRLPPPMPQWKNILYPFSTLMWGLVVVMTLTLAGSTGLLLSYFHHIKDPIAIIFKVAGGLVKQPMTQTEEHQWLGKVLWIKVWLGVWWIVVVVLAAAYMSNLVTVLTLPVLPTLIHTVSELLQGSDKIPTMLDYGSFVPDALLTSPEPSLAQLGEKLYRFPYSKEIIYDEVMVRVAEGTYILIESHVYLIFLRSKHNQIGITYIMKEQIFNGYLSWFLPLHTPYTGDINKALIRLVETGVMDQLFTRHWEKSFKNLDTKADIQVEGVGVLNLGHLQGAFILLALGMSVAAISFVVEVLCSHSLTHSRPNNNDDDDNSTNVIKPADSIILPH
ncbi:hypothetical protein Pmani_023544 [Petrolisthes manimaculis]|uniref:Ionotropic glutamate receptor L-glutamate and glycine-binding domain-containing protein n=1 Tax=Petrolisthes manimaculis TaxID=1843537 RepID=A0AAE1U358_9EUCA|nr:hypothetical protein Pmani_023544 [Petrolisthes manimaculis]